jgi:hypothetical protein
LEIFPVCSLHPSVIWFDDGSEVEVTGSDRRMSLVSFSERIQYRPRPAHPITLRSYLFLPLLQPSQTPTIGNFHALTTRAKPSYISSHTAVLPSSINRQQCTGLPFPDPSSSQPDEVSITVTASRTTVLSTFAPLSSLPQPQPQ